MKEKILVAINNKFLEKIYVDFFEEEGFSVFVTNNSDEILPVINNENPGIVLLDVGLAEKNDFNILKELKKNLPGKQLPVILFSQQSDNGYKEKAIEFEVKDYLVGEYNSPLVVFSKIKTHLEGEMSYLIPVDRNNERIKKLGKDLGDEDLICSKCSSNLDLNLIRDSSKGKNYFKVSLVCPVCGSQKFRNKKNINK